MCVEDMRMERPSTRKPCIMSVTSCIYISFTSQRSTLGHGWHKLPVVSKWQQEILITTPPCDCGYFN